jgi:peptidoglycan/xylan/chitin deacetylase (PgdA/CDA1 family)
LTGLSNALDALAQTGVKATLFVIAQDLADPDKLALVRSAVAQGHEIGSHTVTHRRLTTLSSREKASEVRDSREQIAATLGVPVLGFRAPAFDLDREVIDLVAQAGYRYDSSLFPNARAARSIRVERVSEWPHRLPPASELMELPLPGFAPLPGAVSSVLQSCSRHLVFQGRLTADCADRVPAGIAVPPDRFRRPVA